MTETVGGTGDPRTGLPDGVPTADSITPLIFVEQVAQLAMGKEKSIAAAFQFNFESDGIFVLDCTQDQAVASAESTATVSRTDSQIRCEFNTMIRIASGKLSFPSALLKGLVKVSGNKTALKRLAPVLREAMMKRKKSYSTETSRQTKETQLLPARKWVPDTERSQCQNCKATFRFYLRRHHCRMCGEIFCDPCSSFKWEPHGVRVCGTCHFTKLKTYSAGSTTPLRTPAKAARQIPEEKSRDQPLLLHELETDISKSQQAEVLAEVLTDDERDSMQTRMVEGFRGLDSKLKQSSQRMSHLQSMMVVLIFIVIGVAIGPTLPLDNIKPHLMHLPSVAEINTGMMNTWLSQSWWHLGGVWLLIVALILLYYSQDKIIRRLQVYGLAIFVFGTLQYMKRTEHWREHLTPDENQAEWDRVHDRLALMVLNRIKSLKGFWVKAGQYLSSRADVMPEPWVKHLSKLQDQMPARPVSEVKDVIEAELGATIDDLFVYFDEHALATASIAQVHCATLRSPRRDVVVKVQHYGIKDLMVQDLKNMETIVSWVAYAEPEMDFKPVIQEWAKVAIDEVDFKNEAASQMEVAANLKEAGIDVIVPEVISRSDGVMATTKVIVMEYCEGFKVTDVAQLEKHKVDREALMQRICQAYACQVYVNGVFNADPHPGNILVSLKGGKATPVLLDFGMVKRLEANRKLAFARLVYSASTLDFGGLLQAFDDIGLKLKRDDPMEDMKAIRFVLRDTAPGAEARAKLKEFREEAWKKRQTLPRNQRNPVEAWPPDLLFFFRVTLLLKGMCSVLEVRLRYMEVLKPYAHMCILKSFPLELHAKDIIGGGRTIAKRPTNLKLEHSCQELLRQLYGQGKFTGVQVAVYHHDTLVVDLCGGTMGTADPRPVAKDTLFNGFSVTKAVTAIALHQLVEAGKVDYSAPVSKYWPAFAQNGKQACTIDHVLSHMAGLQRAALGSKYTMKLLCDWNTMLDEMAKATPSSPPGTVSQYHILSFGWIVGGIVQHVTGLSLQKYVQKNIAKPLGIENEFFIGFDEDDLIRKKDKIATIVNDLIKVTGGDIDQSSIQRLMALAEPDSSDPNSLDGEGPQATIKPDKMDENVSKIICKLLDEARNVFQQSESDWVESEDLFGLDLRRQRNGSLIRARSSILASSQTVLNVILDPSQASYINRNVRETMTVQSFNKSNAIIWEDWGNTELCLIRSQLALDDGTIVVCFTSIDHAMAPKKHDREQVDFRAFALRPLGDKSTVVDLVESRDIADTATEILANLKGVVQKAYARKDGPESTSASQEASESLQMESKYDVTKFTRNLNPVQLAQVDSCVEDILRATISDVADTEWTKFAEKNHVSMWKRESSDGNSAVCNVRGRGKIAASPDVVLHYLFDDTASRKRSYDEKWKSSRIIEQIDEFNVVVCNEYEGLWPVAGRDFCALRHHRILENGTHVLCGRHVEHPNCPPSTSSTVRGKAVLNGFVLRPDGDGTIADYVSMTDLCGSIPGFIKDKVAKSQPENVVRLKAAIEKEVHILQKEVTNIKSKSILKSPHGSSTATISDDGGTRRLSEVKLVPERIKVTLVRASADDEFGVGIGTRADGMCHITHIKEDGPAVGLLKLNDVLVAVDGVPSITIQSLRNRFRNAMSLPITVLRESDGVEHGSSKVEDESGGANVVRNLKGELDEIVTKTNLSGNGNADPSNIGSASILLDPCIFNSTNIRRACIPSANGHFSARALAKFYASISSGGKLFGKEILKQRTLPRITEVMTTTTGLGFTPPIQWGRGVEKFTFVSPSGVERSVAFGHAGMGGSIALCDPVEHLSIAICVNQLSLERECTLEILNLITTDFGIGELHT